MQMYVEGRPDLGSSSMNVLPRFGTLLPSVTLRTFQTILSISLLQHLKSLRKKFFFPQFETEFDAKALLLKILHFSTCKKKIAEGTKHTLIQARLAR